MLTPSLAFNFSSLLKSQPGDSEVEDLTAQRLVLAVFDSIKSGKVVGSDLVDGVDANVFLTDSDPHYGGSESGKVRVWAGKVDLLPRKLVAESDAGPPPTMFFYDYNVPITIEPPIH
jgi:hypothetical protein